MKWSKVVTTGFKDGIVTLKKALMALLPEALNKTLAAALPAALDQTLADALPRSGVNVGDFATRTAIVSGDDLVEHTGEGVDPQSYDIEPNKLYDFGEVNGTIDVDGTDTDAALNLYLTEASDAEALTYRGRFTVNSLDSDDGFAVNIMPATGGEAVTIAGTEPTYEVDGTYEFVIFHNVCTITDITAPAGS